MKTSILSVVALFILRVGISAAAGPGAVDRSIGAEPDYQSKRPKYGMLVFGPEADTRVWLALDLAYDPLREKPGEKEALYVDLDGDGDLTDASERIPAIVVTTKSMDHFTFREHEQYLPRFNVGDVSSRDGKTTYAKLAVDVGWYIPGRGDREVWLSVEVPGRGRQAVGGRLLWFSDSPEKAPVIWFDGTLTMRVAPSGTLHFPIDYSGKEPPPPWSEVGPLVRGRRGELRAQIGTAGLGLGTFTPIAVDIPPGEVHPVATIEFSRRDTKGPPIEVTVELNERCCGTLFSAPVDVPEDIAVGKARVSLAFPTWSGSKVESAVVEVPVVE